MQLGRLRLLTKLSRSARHALRAAAGGAAVHAAVAKRAAAALDEDDAQQRLARSLSLLGGSLDRMLQVADAFIVLADDSGSPTRFDVAAVVRELVNLIEPFARERRVTFELADAPPTLIVADAGQVRLTVLDEVIAIVEDTPAGQRLVLQADAAASAPQLVTLRLMNETSGMEPSVVWSLQIRTAADRPDTAALYHGV